jgi:hypothetical protein
MTCIVFWLMPCREVHPPPSSLGHAVQVLVCGRGIGVVAQGFFEGVGKFGQFVI